MDDLKLCCLMTIVACLIKYTSDVLVARFGMLPVFVDRIGVFNPREQ
jgi:hypothetical protein